MPPSGVSEGTAWEPASSSKPRPSDVASAHDCTARLARPSADASPMRRSFTK
ncbi:hypothetical protein AKJ09_04006 [Labilithrix luteola]|uniref:Uncharacterized protein n=1 Tax=Labilithrix luteola TaxID=1391654 RepID=A0A0K1PUZ4_9BACT|nr:hypothetical protein AKJ09_04006 [Labilithrix luteola]